MGEVDDVGGGDSRKEVLGAAREPDNLMREDRTADEHVVVLDQEPVQRNRDRFIEPPAGEIAHGVGGDVPQLDEGGWIVPPVIEDPSFARHAIDHGVTHMPGELRVAHRRVGSERHQEIQRRHTLAELTLEGLEHERHRHRPGAVRDEHQDTPPVERKPGQPLPGQPPDFLGGEIALGHAVADHGVARLRPPMLHVHRSNATRGVEACQEWSTPKRIWLARSVLNQGQPRGQDTQEQAEKGRTDAAGRLRSAVDRWSALPSSLPALLCGFDKRLPLD